MHLRPLAHLTALSPALARLTQFAVAAACLLIAQTSLLGLAHAQTSPPPAAPAPASAPASPPPKVIDNSAMDAELFYQILLSELRLRQNDPGYAYQVYLEVARQHRNGQLFQRSVEIALAARAGEQALAAARSWHTALPQERQASEYTAQILMALGRSSELAEPLKSLVALAPQPQQAQIIATLPRSLSRLSDRKAAAAVVDEVTESWRTPLPGLAEAWAASSEAWLGAGDHTKALERLRRAHTANPHLLNVGLLAVDLMAHDPTTETIVKQQLARQDTAILRLAYARKLVTLQRLADAAIQLDAILVQQPDNALAWLTLGAVRTELKQLDAAEQAIRRFIALATAQDTTPKDDATAQPLDISQGYLRMAQISELRKQPAQSDEWLRKADPSNDKLSIQIARARLMGSQGKLAEARALIRAVPETEPRDALLKINAEAQLLRESRQLEAAAKLLAEASQRFPDDSELLYDRAMLADALKQYAESEALLRQVIALRPDHPHAYNALGYSLSDRGIRLDEARTLIQKALSLRPGDPFITDSLGWLEFRAGKPDEALKWLRQAYAGRADSEIAAHLGEVLWSLGQRDEALRIWREGLNHDPANDTLQSTIKRLQAQP